MFSWKDNNGGLCLGWGVYSSLSIPNVCFFTLPTSSQTDCSFHYLYAVPVGLRKEDYEGRVILLLVSVRYPLGNWWGTL